MVSKQTLYLIIGKWRTPRHSNKKIDDDSHAVKKRILKQIGKKNFEKKIGSNPDIEISESNQIILKGVGDYKRKPYYVTGLSANDYFILRFISVNIMEDVEVQILALDSDKDIKFLNIIANLDRVFKIPNNEQLVEQLVESLSANIISSKVEKTVDYLIILN